MSTEAAAAPTSAPPLDPPVVEILELQEVAAHKAVSRLLASIWRTDESTPPVSADIVRAISHAGGYVAGAYVHDELVGASLGWHAADGSLHSHISGVALSAQGRNVGTALKLHQRSWALSRGLTTVSWTFDPLLRRNAWFNLTKLGAQAVEYLPSFYGEMTDGVNAGDESDRLLVRWDLAGPRAAAASTGAVSEPDEPALLAAGALLVLDERRSAPVTVNPLPDDGRTVLVRLPADAASLRLRDPAQAGAWRVAVRDVLHPLISAGYAVTSVTRTGCYVVEGPAS